MTDDPGDQPHLDYRMSFAAERTYLAYVRTALAMLAAGVAVVGALPDAGHEGVRRGIGVVLVSAALLTTVGARLRWRRAEVAMRSGAELPHTAIELVAVVAVVVAGVLGLVFIALV